MGQANRIEEKGTNQKDKPPKNLTGKTIVTPQGKVRNGQRKPFKKANLKEQAEIIDFVANMLIRQASRYEIHKAVESQFGKSWDQTDRSYVTRAKEQIRKATNITKDQAREIGLGVLLDVVKTEKGNVRVNAERRLSEIFGYNSPTQHRIGDPSGQPISPAVIAPIVNFIIPDNGRKASHDRNGQPAKSRDGD